jgi:hypothetical protein
MVLIFAFKASFFIKVGWQLNLADQVWARSYDSETCSPWVSGLWPVSPGAPQRHFNPARTRAGFFLNPIAAQQDVYSLLRRASELTLEVKSLITHSRQAVSYDSWLPRVTDAYIWVIDAF